MFSILIWLVMSKFRFEFQLVFLSFLQDPFSCPHIEKMKQLFFSLRSLCGSQHEQDNKMLTFQTSVTISIQSCSINICTLFQIYVYNVVVFSQKIRNNIYTILSVASYFSSLCFFWCWDVVQVNKLCSNVCCRQCIKIQSIQSHISIQLQFD